MIFSIFFEIGLLVLGFLYVADMILDSVIELIIVLARDPKNQSGSHRLDPIF